MSVVVTTKPLGEILRGLGLEERGKVQMFVDKTCRDNLLPYLPERNKMLKNNMMIATRLGSGKIIIPGPYARFLNGGKVMVGVNSHSPIARRGEKKILTSRDLKYHKGTKSGPHFWERMCADKKTSILRQVANHAKKVSK